MNSRVPALKNTRHLAVFAAIALPLAGCHDTSNRGPSTPAPQAVQPTSTEAPPTSPPPVEPPQPATHGYFVGSIEGSYGEALLTVDGLVRIYISGVPGASDTLGSRQFVGHLQFTDGEASGTGLVYTQGCDRSNEQPVCGGAAPADVTITTATVAALIGALTLSGDEVWPFEMSWPTYTYLEPATPQFVSGQYTEARAESALDSVINVDSEGRFFYQSPLSGCVGNGSLAPHAEGTFNVYDVDLLVESCASGYEASNGEFAGLATRTVDDSPWGYWGDWLVLWLSTAETVGTPQAFVMWGSRLSGSSDPEVAGPDDSGDGDPCLGCWDY